ncbi:biotin-dependent carboxyltransferase family protein [Gramella jeungdoensis]|uniref:Biotin-dependent carboxyltransferase family protein n=1 Tax=Gramella jeungdoensis TaxID=708091 RepID=A0ABT0Z4E9_9FLAO|nr:biotin-dependent carboxyltransferase family protein [Gramella jeungdoensis]MCM8570592.1 biotin-dependent carboxyltransferase family protein [Gramella jeungdoensis]
MKGEIEVLQPGLFSSIQDLGRFGFQKYGVPQSGVMDRYAMRICNLILGNAQDTSVMEITFQGPQLKFSASTAICISGADLSASLNDSPVEQNKVINISAGDTLRFGARKAGFRAYIGILGGFRSEELMGSQSWYEGLTTDFRLKKGMKLSFGSKDLQEKDTHSHLKIDEEYLGSDIIEAYPGPEFERLSKEQQDKLFSTSFKTDKNSNRMAVQIEEDLENDLDPITTGPVVPGTVQLTPSGKLIILMKDCQTTGGYPRILQLSEKAQQVLSQKMPGEKINFRKLDY